MSRLRKAGVEVVVADRALGISIATQIADHFRSTRKVLMREWSREEVARNGYWPLCADRATSGEKEKDMEDLHPTTEIHRQSQMSADADDLALATKMPPRVRASRKHETSPTEIATSSRDTSRRQQGTRDRFSTVPARTFIIKTRADLATMLDILEVELPRMIATHSREVEFCAEFMRAADMIDDAAGVDDKTYVNWRIDRMLTSRGLIISMVRSRRAVR
jgi:hypothetical protein